MRKKALTAFILAVLTMLAVTAQGAVIIVPELKVSPANSHIFRVSGVDFNVSAPVTLQLLNGSSVAYAFTEIILANDTGKFDAIVVAPTSLSGAFSLTVTSRTTASAYNITGTVQITLPDMTGPQGVAGVNGTQGEIGTVGPAGPQGLQGLQGEVADTGTIATIAVISIVLSLLALAVVFYKKQ